MNGVFDETDRFCCHGCKAVYELIHRLGLDYFYRLRDNRAASESTHPLGSTFRHFDDDKFFHRFVTKLSDGSCRIDLHCPSIHCSACVWLLERLPVTISGITQLRVDLARSRISVWFDPSQIKLSDIGSTLNQLGYEPQPMATTSAASGEKRTDIVFSLQLGVAGFCAMNVMLLFIGRYQGLFSGMDSRYQEFFAWICLLLAIPSVCFSAIPFYKTSLAGLKVRRLHIDLPISIAILGGFTASAVNTVLGRSEIYFDTVTALIFLLLVGRWCQRLGMKRVAAASDLLYSVAPISAMKYEAGNRTEVFVESLRPGDTVAVSPSSRIPCDGIVTSSNAFINNALITGESMPISAAPGSEVFCGALNLGTEILVTVTAVGDRSRIGTLLRDIETASVRDSSIAQFTDSIARYFVAGVLSVAAATFFYFVRFGTWTALDRVFALLIVSCPCALGIATPIVLGLASARASRRGILLRSGTALERVTQVDHFFFDKTGTLTEGKFSVAVSRNLSSEVSDEKISSVITELEKHSEHPIARALLEHAKNGAKGLPARFAVSLAPGLGVSGVDEDGTTWRIGSLDWLESHGILVDSESLGNISRPARSCTVVGIAKGSILVSIFALRDTLRPEALGVLQALANRGIASSIVSGDSIETVTSIADDLGVARDHAHAAVTPEKKAKLIRRAGAHAGFIGDGINDALALSCAGVGIGIHGGAEGCLKVSDVFLLKPDLRLLVDLVDGAHAAVRLVHRHLAVSLVYNIVASSLAVTGVIGPLGAALIMPASSLSVILVSLWKAPFGEVN